MDYLETYKNCVIKPLEDIKAEVIKKYCKSFFFKKKYAKLLDKVEAELINKYQKYYEMCAEEYELKKYIKNELKKDM